MPTVTYIPATGGGRDIFLISIRRRQSRTDNTATEITFNLQDTKGFAGLICADLIQKASDGKTEVDCGTCGASS